MIMTSIVEKKPDKQEFPAVDIIKFLCAFHVVAIHIKPLSSYSSMFAKYLSYGITHYLARIAVPFYFSAADFFLFRKVDKDHYDVAIFEKYILKNVRLLGLWYILLFVGENVQLWYMGALVIGVFLLGVLLHYNVSLKNMTVLAITLYVIGLLGDSYYGVIAPLQSYKLIGYAFKAYDLIFKTTRNGIFMGFPFLILGGIVERYGSQIKPKDAICCFVGSMLLFLGEAFIVKVLDLPRDYNMYICLLPAEFFLLSFATNIKIDNRAIYKKLRAVGIIVYFSHQFVRKWIDGAFIAIKFVSGIELSNSIIYFGIIAIASSVLGFLIERLSHVDKLRFLQYLYS